MLADLRIENLAVVQATKATFTRGLNVISGETGAGKSILLQALSLVTGGRGSSELIRHEAPHAVIEARFCLTGPALERVNRALQDFDLPLSDGELIVRRRLARDGKSRVYINDASATVGALQKVTLDLVEQTGQHEQIGLLRTRRHLDLLDGFAGAQSMRGEVARSVSALRDVEQRRDALLSAKGGRAERAEFLRFYLQEFEDLQPEPGEEERLREEADRLLNAERIRDGLRQALALLYESEGSAFDRLGHGQAQLQSLVSLDPALEGYADHLENLQIEVEEAARNLRTHAHACVRNDDELEQIQSRLHRIQRLCRKHGATLEAVIEKMELARQELQQLEELDIRLEEIERELKVAQDRAIDLAASLSGKRLDAVPGLIAAFDRCGRPNTGHCLETAVFAELCRRGTDATYVRTDSGFEVDFLAIESNGSETLLQVCADLDDPGTTAREVRALLDARETFPRAPCVILTLGTRLPRPAVPNTIAVEAAWQWMLRRGGAPAEGDDHR